MFFDRLKISGRRIFLYAALFVTLICCGELADARADTRYSTIDGKVIYEKLCSSCHGLNGYPPREALLLYNPAPRPFLSGNFAYGEKSEDIYHTISEGKGRNMLSFKGRLTQPQIQAVANYVMTLKDKLPSPQERTGPVQPPSAPEPIEAAPQALPQ